MNVIRLYRAPMGASRFAAAVIAALGAAALPSPRMPRRSARRDGKGQAMGPTTPSGVTDVVAPAPTWPRSRSPCRGAVRLRSSRCSRRRRPWHSHNERPAMI